MAIFNPEVSPTQTPNYFKYSEPIGNVKSDNSAGMLLSTIGEGIEGAAKLADTTIKGKIGEDVRTMAESERSKFASALETIHPVVPGPVQTPGGATVKLSFADETPPAAPAAIDAALSKVQSVQGALESGKVNDTYYTQQLSSGVQRLRAQYPGYVDYIDSKVAQITGMNPANEYVKNLMQDINRAQTNKKTEFDKELDMARRALGEGIPNADVMFNRLQADPSFAPQFRTWYNQENSKMYTIKLQDAQRANMKGTKEEIAGNRAEDFTREVGMTIDNQFHSQTKLTGTNTPQGILDFVGEVARGDRKATDAQMEQLATLMLAQKNTLATQLAARSNQLVSGPNGTKVSYASDIGTQKRDDIIKSQLGIYDLVIESIKHKDMGAAYTHMNQARGILDTTKSQILTSDMGSYAAKSKAFLDFMGPNWTNMTTMEGLRKNMDDASRVVFNDNALDARLQPNLATTGIPTTVTDHMEAVKKKMSATQKAVHYDNLLNLVDDLRNPKAPDGDKANIVKYFYSPEATNLLKNFKMDYTDPTTKQVVPGKYAAWTRLTTPDITDSIAKMGKSDPESAQKYRNWVEITGKQLFGEDVRNLNHFTGHDNLYFEWNGNTKQLTLRDKEGGLAPPVINSAGRAVGAVNPIDEGYKYQVQAIVKRVNGALTNLSHVENSFHGDTEAYVLSMLQQYGMDFNGKISGLPKAIGDAIAASRAPQRRIEDTFGNLK